ncbi:hypothetical protein LJK87_10915 [Paenibacillus sp. P25]|nr:hypothetical protein LJK87_10915 [Paenibacillus sp. P25]
MCRPSAGGERVEDGTRELEEELGLSVPFEELFSCGIFPEEDDLGPHGFDREFCHLFLYRCDKPLDGFRLQPDEVTGLYRVPLESVRQMADHTFTECRMEGVKLEEDGTLTAVRTTGKAAEFVPHPAAYYGQLLKAWDRYREMNDAASGK